MHDLRWDQEAEDAATHARLKATVRVRVLTPEQLRTVEMPNLRSPEARSLDGETRDLCPYAERNDERLARIEEAIERIADKVTVLMRRGNVKAALLLQPDAAGRHWWSAASCMCGWRMRRR